MNTHQEEPCFWKTIHNPAPKGLVKGTHFSNHLLIVDAASRLVVPVGLNSMESQSGIEALEIFEVEHRPFHTYNFDDDLHCIHADAGSIFDSKEF